MDEWRGYGGDLAASAATLVGLLFVAISVQQDRFRQSHALRARAGQALVLFSAPFFAGILLATPSQGAVAVGAEIIVLALVVGAASYVFDRAATRAREPAEQGFVDLLGRVTPAVSATILLAIAGLATIVIGSSALLVLLPAVVVCLGAGIALSWLLLMH